MDEKIAIIDLGSNSIRMIIMKIAANGSYKLIDQAKNMVRLSEGMSEKNYLREPAMQRAYDILKLFRKLIESHQVDRIIAVATAAVRNAINGQYFRERVKIESGFDFSVITGIEEAYFDYLAVINTIDLANFVIVDTGGGSTEIVLVENRKLKNSISIPYGAVILTEKFFAGEDEIQQKLKKSENFIREKIKKISWLENIKGLPVIGLGGSIRNLAKIDKKLRGFAFDGMHNFAVNVEDVREIYEKIAGTKLEERKKIPGIGKDRADIILGGIIPLKVVMEHIDSDLLVISGNGLREGVFYHHFHEACGLKSEIVDSVIEHSINNTLKKYDANISHSHQVSKLALEMFDQLLEIHKLKKKYRKLLELGALLHDIGLYVDYYNHHSHGFYLTMSSGVNGLNYQELIICAFIVGLHRNDIFKQDWKEFGLFIDKDDYEAIEKLGMLVKIAEGLDRNEYGNIAGIKCYVSNDQVRIKLQTEQIIDLEIAAAELRSKAFKKIFGKSLTIERISG